MRLSYLCIYYIPYKIFISFFNVTKYNMRTIYVFDKKYKVSRERKRERERQECWDKIFKKNCQYMHILTISIQYWLKHQLILVSDYSQFCHFITINIHSQKIKITDAVMAYTFTISRTSKSLFPSESRCSIYFVVVNNGVKNSFTWNCRENSRAVFARGDTTLWKDGF